MSLIGRNTLSLRKKDVLEQKESGTAYQRLIFAHKATAGETGIDLTALVQPSEMAALGFVNPNISDLLAAKLLFHKKNLTVVSSVQGILIQDLQYTVPTNQRIAFQGFTSSLDEIFTCILESSVKDGLNVVDSTRIISTGLLPASVVQYNVGTPFQVGKYITQQVGAVMVFLDGVQQFRNTNNSSVTLDGNYYEIAAGSGLGSIIQFNAVDAINDRSVLVIGENAAERPTGSMMAVIESIAGQMDQVIPTVAALAGVPETNFQAAPNNVDLKNFGDKVNDIETDLNAQIAYLATAQVPITTDWVEYFPTLTGFGTIITSKFIWRRNGNNVEVSGWWTNGTVAAAVASITLPLGQSISTDFARGNTTASPGHMVGRYTTNTAVNQGNMVTATGTSTSLVYFADSETLTAPLTPANGSALAVSSAVMSVNFSVGITGWTATETLAQQLGI